MKGSSGDVKKAKIILDVAFGRFDKVLKKSYHKTIDVVFGVYRGGEYDGWLAVSLKPSKGWLDWLINLFAFPHREYYWGGMAHGGYWREIERYWDNFKLVITGTPALDEAYKKGIIVSGRSKGAAEAVLIGMRMAYLGCHMLVGAVEPPRMCSRGFARTAEEKIGVDNIICIVYQNDIVPGVPPWFVLPGTLIQIGNRRHGLSVNDHITATTEADVLYEALNIK